jgi:uncharacterized protein (TIRG00374 family)
VEPANSGERRFSWRKFNGLRALKILVSLSLLVFIFSRIGWRPVIDSFKDIRWYWAASRIVLVPILVLLQTVRWRRLLIQLNLFPSIRSLFKRILIARFVNNFLPGQSGGDLYRVFGRWDAPMKRAELGSSVVIDRLTGLMGLLTLVTILGFVEFRLTRALNLGWLPLLCLLGAMTLLVLVTRIRALEWLRRRVGGCRFAKIKRFVDDVVGSLLVYSGRPGAILGAVLISVVAHIVAGSMIGCDFRALGIDVPLRTVIFISALSSIVSLIPVSINGWGIYEGAFVLMFSIAGVEAEQALAAALLGRALGTAFSSTVGGVLYTTQR